MSYMDMCIRVCSYSFTFVHTQYALCVTAHYLGCLQINVCLLYVCLYVFNNFLHACACEYSLVLTHVNVFILYYSDAVYTS